MASATPIAFIAFNRPARVAASFARIREQRPVDLFLIADGPREGAATDPQRCLEVRELLADIDWPCHVRRLYAPTNLGLNRRIQTGLDAVFSEVERAIVIEDDCVANADFFRFCENLLDRYQDDDRVAAVTGDNFQDGIVRGDASYYFSKYMHAWGWATWRRSWQHYDPDLSFWPELRNSPSWQRIHPDRVERRYWNRIFDGVAEGGAASWDTRFQAAVWHQDLLTATPNVNLVENIGFGPEATHTKHVGYPKPVRAGRLGPLTHPTRVTQGTEADRHTFDHHHGGVTFRPPRHPIRFLGWSAARVLRRVLPEPIKAGVRTWRSRTPTG